MKLNLATNAGFAEIDTTGAQLMSLRDALGTEYLWQGDPRYWAERSPLLFPMVGRLRGGKTLIGGREYSMGCHGFASAQEFRPVMQSSDSVTLSLRANEQTLAQYPFDFHLLASYQLADNRLSVSLEVMNLGDVPMPFAIGGHPGFRVPLDAGDAFENYSVEFEQKETASCPRVTKEGLIDFTDLTPVLRDENRIPLRHDLFVPDALVFENLNSQRVRLVSRLTGRGVELDFTGFRFLGIWSTGDAPFVALEPWTGCADCIGESGVFQEKRGMTLLPPLESRKYTYRITML